MGAGGALFGVCVVCVLDVYRKATSMKTLLLTLTYLVGAGELVLAIYFWVTNSKSEVRKVLGLAFFSAAGWAISNCQPNAGLSILGVLPFIFGPLLLVALVHFAIVYPYKKFTFDKLHAMFLYVPWIFFSYLIFATHTVITDIYIVNNASYTTGGPLFGIFNIYLGVLYLGAVIILAWKSRQLDGMFRRNTQIAFWSILIGGLPGSVLAIVHGFQSLPFNYLYGPIGTALWPLMTLYVVRKSS